MPFQRAAARVMLRRSIQPVATRTEDRSRTMDRDDPAYRGQSDYTRPLLRLYDPLVLGPVARFVWRCPTTRLVDGYRRHIRDRHLDVGPGTGYFIDRSSLPDGSRVSILDPNTTVLDHASRRLRRLDVTAVEADVLKPLPVDGPFDSAALHLVIHCLPGPLPRKAPAIANVAAVLAPTGVLFGASVLGTSGPQTWLSRRVLDAFNRRAAFDNLDDTEDGLREILAASFAHVELETVGSIAIFAATNPRTGFGEA
jgi:SAM-dependent methyltransferase